MEKINCKLCGIEIPESKRSDSIFCCPKHGWDFRNNKEREEIKERKETDRKLNKNYKIVSDLYKKGKDDVSVEVLELLGFDLKYFTEFIGVDPVEKTTTVKVHQFTITYNRDRCKITK